MYAICIHHLPFGKEKHLYLEMAALGLNYIANTPR